MRRVSTMRRSLGGGCRWRLHLTGFSCWAIAVGALFEWEAPAFKDGARSWHPALTTLIDPMLGTRPVKAAGILIWLLAGWALVRR
jgi:hypothetical protein